LVAVLATRAMGNRSGIGVRRGGSRSNADAVPQL